MFCFKKLKQTFVIFGITFITLFQFSSCKGSGSEGSLLNHDATASEDGETSLSGNLIIANEYGYNVLMLDSEGRYLKTLADFPQVATNRPWGLELIGDELHIVVDGNDRVMKVNIHTGIMSTFLLDSQLNGNVRGITRLLSGDWLVVESNNIEKFNAYQIRDTTGGYPKSLQSAGSGIDATPDGGFILCSTGTRVIRKYNSSATQEYTVSAPSGHQVYDCQYNDQTGKVAAAMSGTTDQVRLYSDTTFSTLEYTFTGNLYNPRAVTFTSTGEVLVADQYYNHILKITPSGTLDDVLKPVVANQITRMITVP